MLPLLSPGLARAATTHEVEMLNQNPDNPRERMVFRPMLLVIQAGDTVTFLSSERGHNSASIDGMIPEGAEPWDSRINEDLSVTLDIPGFYGYMCTPHASVGMVGLIVVEGDGMTDNYQTARDVRQRGRAAEVFDEIWTEVEARGLVA